MLRYGIDDLRDSSTYKLLSEKIVKKDADGRAWLYEPVRNLDNGLSISDLAASLDLRFSIKGLFSLFPVMPSFVPFVDINRYAEVLRFRAKVALAVCPLPQIEKLVFDIQGCNPEIGEYPGGVRESTSCYAGKT